MPINARGLNFPDIEACILWAEDQPGIGDARAFCGQLEAESGDSETAQEAENGGVARHSNKVKGDMHDSPEVSPMTQQSTQQSAKQATKTEQAGSEQGGQDATAKQAATDGAAKQADGDYSGDRDEILSEVMRRLEALETNVGEIAARVGGNDTEEADDYSEDKEKEEETEEADDNGDKDDDEEDEGREAKPAKTSGLSMAQAKKLFQAELKQAFSGDTFKQALQGAVGEFQQANKPEGTQQAEAGKTEQATPSQQATDGEATRQATTPDPSDSPSNGKGSDTELRQAAKRMDAGDPTAFSDLLHAASE